MTIVSLIPGLSCIWRGYSDRAGTLADLYRLPGLTSDRLFAFVTRFTNSPCYIVSE